MSESYDDASSGFVLRQELRESVGGGSDVGSFWRDLPSHGVYQLVGHGSQTNQYCGTFRAYRGCLGGEGGVNHNVCDVQGNNYKGKAYVRIGHHYCNKPSCPKCYKYGWAVREAKSIEARLVEASKRWGLVEHIAVSFCPKDYGLSFESSRDKALKVVFKLGVVGGTLIYHGFRFARSRGWYWSPHLHILGFILGGYGCRGCDNLVGVGHIADHARCMGCKGFEGRVRRENEKSGLIVKVLGKRQTVYGTAWYQLNHATIRTDVVRPHACVWFGACSYRKLKVTVEKRKDLCPICSGELVKLHYLGVRPIVKERDASGYVGSFVDDVVGGDGGFNWVEAVGGYG